MLSSKINFSPGAKNWIPKYFQLVDQGFLSYNEDFGNEDSIHPLRFILNKTGLLYGSVSQLIYSVKLDSKHFTKDEKLKLLLFEALIFVYRKNVKEFNENEFLSALGEFYGDSELNQFEHWLNYFSEKTIESKIEKILADRVKVKTAIFGTNYWLNHLSNSFVFLDVILFDQFLKKETSSFFESYQSYSFVTLKCLIFVAYLDQQVEEKEQRLLWHFLASADLEKEQKQFCEKAIIEGISENSLGYETMNDSLMKTLIFELSIFVSKGTHFLSKKEEDKIIAFAKKLTLSDTDVQLAFMLCNSYLLENADEIALLKSESNTQFVYKSFSKRWYKILGRNKEKLIHELKESKELVSLIQKSTKEELTKEEKELVKNQFLDILKSMPSMAIFLLPGGGFLLPLILKIVPDLLPSSFKENEVEK
jgi:hypothetical protein